MRNYLLLVTILLTVALSGCSKKHDAGTVENAPAVVVKGVSMETVKSSALPELLDVVGSVRARTSAVVSTRIPGSISVLRVREGDRVKKGQLLAQLDARENQATAAVATAAIDETRRGLDEALSRKKLADSTFDRYNNLLKEQAVSRQEFDVKQTEKDVAAQGVARAESRLRQAQESAKASTTRRPRKGTHLRASSPPDAPPPWPRRTRWPAAWFRCALPRCRRRRGRRRRARSCARSLRPRASATERAWWGGRPPGCDRRPEGAAPSCR